ncbi:POT family-domain-containing protein [Aspergillus filifer]
MNQADSVEIGDAIAAQKNAQLPSEKAMIAREASISEAPPSIKEYPSGGEDHDSEALQKIYPTDEEMHTLRRVAGPMNWITFSVAFVELCERFSYYGTTAVFVNFIQQPLPPGSSAGNLIISAIPQVISNPNGAIGCFAVGLIIMGMGTGGFKSNISALIAEQYPDERPVIKTLASGERIIIDPAATVARVYLYFYLCINVGSLTGQISMVYAERGVGFWLSFLLPTLMFCLSPLVLYFCRNKYHLVPPTGSVYTQAYRLIREACRKHWTVKHRIAGIPVVIKKNDTHFWNAVKPTTLGESRPTWMTFDDEWVDEVARGLKACRVFLWYPLYWLAYNQMLNNLTSQAATMELNGVPNDIINNFNPLALIIFIPIFDRLLYPGLRRIGIHFTPLKRITAGFFVAGAGMIVATVTQHYIYKLGQCGKHANECLEDGIHAPISVWVQALTYILGGISEILASVTSLEYAFTKAPKNMRSLVQAVSLFMNAFSSAIGQALVPLADDPLLVWNYAVVAILAFVGGIGFWLSNYKLDRQEDELNTLKQSRFEGSGLKVDEEARS